MALQSGQHGDGDGDRIFLVGFSRGAYTVRSVAGVMSHCGIPRYLPDGSPLRRDPKSIHKLAEHAIKDVYQFCPSCNRRETRGYWQFLMETRDAIAAQFRKLCGCALVTSGVELANVVPYFIGVFDTVAALGHKYLGPALVALGVAILLGPHYLGDVLEPIFPWAGWAARILSYLGVATRCPNERLLFYEDHVGFSKYSTSARRTCDLIQGCFCISPEMMPSHPALMR
jgi:Uncharacterized alpha/beta hydrolase domain (DUF2235)